jgi:hypothetical protein
MRRFESSRPSHAVVSRAHVVVGSIDAIKHVRLALAAEKDASMAPPVMPPAPRAADASK